MSNLTVVCAILFACLFLGEPFQLYAMVGGAISLFGAEWVRQASLPQLSISYLSAKRRLDSLASYSMSA